MYDFHKHTLTEDEVAYLEKRQEPKDESDKLKRKNSSVELAIAQIKVEINKRIDAMEIILCQLNPKPHLCYFTTRKEVDDDLGDGPRPKPGPGQTVIIIEDHPEYQPYFKAVFAHEDACAALVARNRELERVKKLLKRKTKKRMKGQD